MGFADTFDTPDSSLDAFHLVLELAHRVSWVANTGNTFPSGFGALEKGLSESSWESLRPFVRVEAAGIEPASYVRLSRNITRF